jgi:hypothetical protein
MESDAFSFNAAASAWGLKNPFLTAFLGLYSEEMNSSKAIQAHNGGMCTGKPLAESPPALPAPGTF